MGVVNEKENKKACQEVQVDKREEDMTHGVETSTINYEDTLLSLWDFAGNHPQII